MLAVSRRLVVAVLALVLFCVATTAVAATVSGLYRTDAQAAHFLTHRLQRWAGLDLSKFPSSAYCVGAGQGRLNHDGVPVYRSFSCVLNVTVASGKNGTRVFQLDLVKEYRGWQITSDSA